MEEISFPVREREREISYLVEQLPPHLNSLVTTKGNPYKYRTGLSIFSSNKIIISLNSSVINPFLSTMSISLSSSPLSTLSTPPSGIIGRNCSASKVVFFKNSTHKSRFPKLQAVEDKAGGDESNSEKPVQKINSLYCTQCEGNGAILCTQCLGNGINSKDHFNGMFKTGGLCWLCRGKRDILCGECNGAGFMGGFMNTADS